MAKASARAPKGALITNVVSVAAVLVVGGAGVAVADPVKGESRASAPIVYAGAEAQSPITNSLASRPAGNVGFDEFQGRSGAIDLRPGVVSTSFSAGAFAKPTLKPAQPKATIQPAAPSASDFAEPYAGPPYQVDGKWYVPTHEPNYDETGIASWYGPSFHGKDSASGEAFDEMALTAAHPTLPIPSLVRVTNLENGKSVVVRLNDRGPFVDDRIIDLSKRAGEVLEMHKKGTAKVRVQYVGPAPAEANAAPQTGQADLIPVSAPANPVFTAKPIAAMTLPAPTAEARAASGVASSTELVRADESLRGFYLQAGSFADLGNAHKLRTTLQDVGPAFVTPTSVNGAEFYRVMLGPWTSRADAERAQGRLIESGAKAIVVARIDN
jgi:rare lipoprotein A